MSIAVKENVFDQPDVSRITPLKCSFGRSMDVWVVFLNDKKKYQRTVGYWNDIDKTWYETSNGNRITDDPENIVRTEPLTE